MKGLIIVILLLSIKSSFQLNAQSLSGTWAGQVTSILNSNAVAQSIFTIRVVGTKLVGEYWIEFNGKKDKYLVQGTVQESLANCLATYPVDGSVFQIELALHNEQLTIVIGQLGIPLMTGNLYREKNRPMSSANQNSKQALPQSGATRDSRLIGVWCWESMNQVAITSNYWILRGDGSVDGYAEINYLLLSDFTPSREYIEEIENLKRNGGRWFTDNGGLCFSYPNGKVECNVKYSVDNEMMIWQFKKSGSVRKHKRME